MTNKRYLQPEDFSQNANYSGYLKSIVPAEEWQAYLKLRKDLMNVIPKLGEIGVDELILKLSSFLNQS